MVFNSLEFAIFLPIVFSVFWILNGISLKLRNAFLLVSSYVFYGWWDWRFLFLILLSSVVDFIIGKNLESERVHKRKKIYLYSSVIINLGILGVFKYYNFFVENFVNAFSFFGYHLSSNSLSIILPVGISFYTFQTLSYSLDVYKGKIKACRDFLQFATFVSFFPQLVAGPIERASNLLPQFEKINKFEYSRATEGLRQILWGLFKKVVIADSCAGYVNMVFDNYMGLPGSTLLLGAVFFAFQIYGDFSGYSDIAIGTAKLLGFSLMKNFSNPYFSRDIAEFWRRWHISLSTWFRDYVYIPLGGSKGGFLIKVRNTFIIFIISGFWHGANWTFITWGLLNALFFLPLLLNRNNRRYLEDISHGRVWPNLGEFVSIISTFTLTVFAWIFFRSGTVSGAINYISGIFSFSFFDIPFKYDLLNCALLVGLILIQLLLEWFKRMDEFPLQKFLFGWKRPYRWGVYFLLILAIVGNSGQEHDFIYFQF